MKKLFALAALAVVAAGAHAVTLTYDFDVTGIQSFDGPDDPGNTYVTLDLNSIFSNAYTGYHLVGLGWDVNLTARTDVGIAGGSWLSELTVETTNTSFAGGIDLSPGFGTDNPGTASFSSGGVLDLVSLGFDFTTDADNKLNLQFFEGYDDQAGTNDGVWNSGHLTYQFEAQAVPEPTSMAVLGLGAAALIRKRRKK